MYVSSDFSAKTYKHITRLLAITTATTTNGREGQVYVLNHNFSTTHRSRVAGMKQYWNMALDFRFDFVSLAGVSTTIRCHVRSHTVNPWAFCQHFYTRFDQ